MLALDEAAQPLIRVTDISEASLEQPTRFPSTKMPLLRDIILAPDKCSFEVTLLLKMPRFPNLLSGLILQLSRGLYL